MEDCSPTARSTESQAGECKASKGKAGEGKAVAAQLTPGSGAGAAARSPSRNDSLSASASLASSLAGDNDSWGSDFESQEFSRANQDSAEEEDYYETVEDQVRIPFCFPF